MICQIGTEVCKDLDGTWIVDPIMSRCVGFWQGFVLYVLASFSLKCNANARTVILMLHVLKILKSVVSLAVSVELRANLPSNQKLIPGYKSMGY